MLAKSSPSSRGPGRLNAAAAVTAVGAPTPAVLSSSGDGGCFGAASGDTAAGASTRARVDVRQARAK
ncbi:hypothetical protein DSC45_20615 [Streptomyces sp. YIM 130001]|nr:hypothetical protein DSC45_20615 [Streptomyces sp. YIM 130001]